MSRIPAGWIAPLALLASACGVDNIPPEVATGTAVLTYHAPGTDFGAYPTYALASQLVVEEESAGTITYRFVPAPEILGAIERNMAARGYVKVADVDPANPPPTPPAADLGVFAVALQATSYTYFPCYADWWGYPGYGCEFSWVWVAYRTGTLLVEMADLRSAPPPGSTTPALATLWAAAGYSVLTPSASANVQIAVGAVNQAFAQSPYLQTP
jgi:hypothetical protein